MPVYNEAVQAFRERAAKVFHVQYGEAPMPKDEAPYIKTLNARYMGNFLGSMSVKEPFSPIILIDGARFPERFRIPRSFTYAARPAWKKERRNREYPASCRLGEQGRDAEGLRGHPGLDRKCRFFIKEKHVRVDMLFLSQRDCFLRCPRSQSSLRMASS